MTSGDKIGEWTFYFFFVIFIIMAIVQYIRASKPYRSGLIGLILLLIIAGLFIIYKLFFPSSPLVPRYASVLPPIGLMWCIYYLTFTQNKRNRLMIAIAALGIVVLIVTYFFAVIYP